MKTLKTLLIIILSISVWSCQKDDIYELVDTAKIISQKDDIIDEVVEEVADSTATKEPDPPFSGILVSKNSNYIDYSDSARETYHVANSRDYININGEEYFVIVAHRGDSYLYKKKDTIWNLVDVNSNYTITGASGIVMIDDNSFIVGETGEDHQIPQSQWGGYIHKGEIINDKLVFTKLTDIKDYYGKPTYSDISGDGLGDIILNSGWVYIQEESGNFTPYNISSNPGSNWGLDYSPYQNKLELIDTERFQELNNNMSTESLDLFPGGRNEIIFSFIDISERVSESEPAPRGDVIIYEFNENSNKYEIVFELPRRIPGITSTVSDIRVGDVNNDGINDIILSTVSGDSADTVNYSPPIEVWLGNGDKTFYKHDSFIKEVDPMGFNLFDVNNDGYLDIILNPFGDSQDWIRNWCSSDCSSRTQAGESVKDGLLLHNTIYINDGFGSFNKIEKETVIEDTYTTFLYSFMRNDNLSFVGAVYKNLADGASAQMDIEFIDIEFKNYFE